MNWIKGIFIVTVSTLISLKSGDFLIGYFSPEVQFPIEERGIERSILIREHNPNFKATYIPTKAYLNVTDSLDSKGYTLKTDKNGFIENGNKINFSSEDVTTIIYFGGSTTEQVFVPEEFRWQSIIERRLNETQNSPRIRVLNGGVSGNNSLHSTLNLIAKGIPIKPQFVVLMHNVNDYALLRLSGSYWIAPQDKDIVRPDRNKLIFYLKRGIKDLIIPNIYELYKIVQSNAHSRDDLRTIRTEKTVSLEIVEENFRNSINAFIDLSVTWGIEPILMTQFNRINTEDDLFNRIYLNQDIDTYIEGYSRLNNVIREISQKRQIDLIDLEELVPSTSDYIYDAIHLNENGSKLVADILTDYWFKKLGIN